MPSPVRYYVLTRGRVGRQETVKNLPPAVRSVLTIVCPENEVLAHQSNHPDVEVVAQPDHVKTIGQKRAWVMTMLADRDQFAWMLDDDLRFKVRNDGRFFRPPTTDYPPFEETFHVDLPLLMRSYPVVGVGTSYFAPKTGHRENYHLGFMFGCNRQVRDKIHWGRLDVFEDIDYTLQFLRGGHRIAVSYDITVDQVKPTVGDDLAQGGVAGERTLQTIQENLARLVAYHPGIVSAKEARPGAHPAAVTRVLWNRAAREGGLR